MSLDILILNSGDWILGEELPATPWYILIYRQRGAPRNELHVWLPREDAQRSGDYAFKRYWINDAVRWCVESPGAAEPGIGRGNTATPKIRFTSPEGRVLWATAHSGRGLGDLTEYDLSCLLDSARKGAYTGT